MTHNNRKDESILNRFRILYVKLTNGFIIAIENILQHMYHPWNSYHYKHISTECW